MAELRGFLSTPIKPTQEGMKEACQRAERLIKDFARGYGNGPPAVKAIEQIWQKLAETPDLNPVILYLRNAVISEDAHRNLSGMRSGAKL